MAAWAMARLRAASGGGVRSARITARIASFQCKTTSWGPRQAALSGAAGVAGSWAGVRKARVRMMPAMLSSKVAELLCAAHSNSLIPNDLRRARSRFDVGLRENSTSRQDVAVA